MTEDEPAPVRRGRVAMRQAVADFAAPAAGWHLIVQCAGHCRRQHRLVAELVPQISPGLTWAEVLPKLRCNQCGKPADIVGLSGPPETPGVGGTWLLLQRGAGQWRI
ncbi:hypothetical protein [Belnapia sp. F-4-1]|uniref:hypothetical protein n=1 Tax=Belnapia sp. F-4-1 TaxID=1545443 RepID=UPI0005B9B30B|nr:hypothetical protein [Belnapia sp. F-4-1]